MIRAMSSRAWPWRLAFLESQRRLGWALLLALLLPLAQAAAAGHAITHHGNPQQRDSAPAGLLDAPCALCVLAAPLSAGALPSVQARAPALPGPQAVAAAPAWPEPASADALAYRSRAPPAALH
jgi:hypothetical protein